MWKRLETIYGFYDAKDKLAAVYKAAPSPAKPPEATHCNNIRSAASAKVFIPILKQWFDMPIPEKESNVRYKSDELACLTPELAKTMEPMCVPAEEVGRLNGAGDGSAAIRKNC